MTCQRCNELENQLESIRNSLPTEIELEARLRGLEEMVTQRAADIKQAEQRGFESASKFNAESFLMYLEDRDQMGRLAYYFEDIKEFYEQWKAEKMKESK